jgi:chaperone modulatory protein CbpM
MNTSTTVVAVCLVGEHTLDLEAFALATGVDGVAIQQLVEEGLLMPATGHADTPAQWRFDGEALARARRIFRLQRDFDANLHCVAVMVQLLDEIESLRAQLRRAGIPLPGGS